MEKTLAQLENRNTMTVPSEGQSFLIRQIHYLRHKPIAEFSVEDLRLMIGQNLGLKYLMPLAISFLEKDLFIAGDYYPGDLLKNVLSVPKVYWVDNLEQKLHLLTICEVQLKNIETVDILDDIREEIKAIYLSFAY